jgi:hypothetical protein
MARSARNAEAIVPASQLAEQSYQRFASAASHQNR